MLVKDLSTKGLIKSKIRKLNFILKPCGLKIGINANKITALYKYRDNAPCRKFIGFHPLVVPSDASFSSRYYLFFFQISDISPALKDGCK